ncbi:Hypothetical protein PBC10988_4830 [Planctomycetales bacterium 10988]|nr:Hypothetical protein PBC10988_4830 [Planctomycetales bacterium 10988]
MDLLSTKPGTKHKRIGVVGLLQSGKTVFLTSLIDHLQKHDPERFRLGEVKGGWSGSRKKKDHQRQMIKIVPLIRKNIASSTGWQPFEYERNRSKLAHHEWPTKTVIPQEYRGVFARSDWKWDKIDLSLLDIPGERLTDLLIANCKTFGEWSDIILNQLSIVPEFKKHASEYLQLVDTPPHDSSDWVEEEVLCTYRRALARLAYNSIPFISPSTFLIDEDGNYVPDEILGIEDPSKLEDELVKRQFVGRDARKQFSPLPARFREKSPDISEKFAKNYDRYRREFVLHFAKAIKSCDEILFLVDIASILEGGVGYLNSQEAFCNQLWGYIDPGLSPVGRVGTFLSRVFTLGYAPLRHVKRIAFIASKADRIHPEDYGNLEHLLRTLVRKHVDPFEIERRLEVSYHYCSAVHSTEPTGDNRCLKYRRYINGSEPDERRQNVSPLPEEWPDIFTGSDYHFPYPVPFFPKARLNPPKQFGLNDIAKIILS